MRKEARTGRPFRIFPHFPLYYRRLRARRPNRIDLADLELLEASIGRAHAEGLSHRPSAALASDGSPSSPLISSSAASPRRSDRPQRQRSRLRGSDDEVSVPAEALSYRARRASGGDDAGARWSSLCVVVLVQMPIKTAKQSYQKFK